MNTLPDEEQQDLMIRCVRLEEENAVLATLYVASQSLHNSLKRTDLLLSLREIVANLIGCEEYALFMVEHGELRLVDSFGVSPARLAGSASVMHCAQTVMNTGEAFWTESDELTGCIPLRLDGAVTGVLVLFRLLPQKFELHEGDRDLFRVLETQLAMALYCADLHEKQIAPNEVTP